MACFRLFTVPPLPPGPLFSVPFLRRRIALSTRFDAAVPYFFRELFRFAAAMTHPGCLLLGRGGKKPAISPRYQLSAISYALKQRGLWTLRNDASRGSS